MVADMIPAVDENYSFPQPVRDRLAVDLAGAGGFAARAYLIDVRDYLDGDPMPTATTGDMGALLNTALAAAQALADDDPGGTYLVGVPAGRFQVTTEVGFNQARSHERIGIRGAGKFSTVFVCVGGISFFHPLNSAQTPGSLSEYACEECVFSDFSVDMTGTTSPDPTGSSYKVFKGAGWRACRFERLYGAGSPATAFGNDYPVQCVFESVTARGAGRGTAASTSYWQNGTRSGFGIAVGWSEDESATFIDCHAIDNLRSGFLFEYQAATSTTQQQRMNLTGCSAVGNFMGLSAAGSGGVYASGCQFNANTMAGVYVGVNESSPVAGRAVELVDCELVGNAYGFYASAVSSPAFSPADAAPPVSAGGTRVTRCRIRGNTSHGVYARQMPLGDGGFQVEGCTFDSNGGSGIRFERAHTAWAGVRVNGNDFTGQSRHLDMLVPLTAPTVRDNTFYGGAVGIAYHPASNATDAIQAGNTFYDVTTPVQVAAGVLADPTDDRDASACVFTHHEYLGDADLVFPTAGWTAADLYGTEATWTATVAGIQVAGSSGQDALAYRDMGGSGIYAEVWLRNATASQSPSRMVVLSFTGTDVFDTGDLRAFVGAGVYNALSSFYCLFKLRTTSSDGPTVVWESAVPIEEAHVVGIRRAPGSTVTQMFIDGQLVHEEDVADIPSTQYAGLYGLVTSAQNRRMQVVNLETIPA